MRAGLHIVALAAAGLALPLPAAASEDGKCYQSWTEAAPIVRREQLATAQDVHLLARKRQVGEPIRITLCVEKGRYVYRLVLQGAAGEVKNLTVDARKPF